MSGRLIWLCLAAMLLTAITLIEAIRDYRAIIRRKSDKKLLEVAAHCIVLESMRVAKVTLLGFGVYMTTRGWIDYDMMRLRNWIMAVVACGIGFSSLLDLSFRHKMMKRIRQEYRSK